MDGRPVVNRDANIITLAKTVLAGVDRSRLETSVQTETLCLLLNSLIDFATPSVNEKYADLMAREVLARKAEIEGV